MSLADLTFDRWRALDRDAAHRLACEAARSVGGRLVEFGGTPRPGGVVHRAVIERGGELFALIPGGEVAVGFDLERWRPLPEQLDSYRTQSLAGGFGFDDDLVAHLARCLTPRRTATVPTVLMAVEPRELPEEAESVQDFLTERGLRLPAPDEWEHACGAGAKTLFRWGSACPLDRAPYGEHDDPGGHRRRPNAFGLRIARDVYESELTSDPGSVYGGDGGEAVCGGYGDFVAWLPLATANRNPGMAEFLNGPEGEDMGDECGLRPVLDLG
ncbi:hypothetical protein [Streptomyces sp. NP-1717]|uniref:hypothetical protein n=1 Tax=Streptomyces sp. NP-1717 TaxID=2704470 RepID=UPI001F5D66B7|nr:hypothetical protein [Streptomyces sp. NP-1717]MCI3222163.1 hypothetical protein [Streptomyces sp. NP-1717]